jgi:toxin ParE1/3/4
VTGSIVRARAALRDLDENADYLQSQSGPERAIRFLRAAEATFQRLATLPNMGTAFDPGDPRFAGVRYCPVSRFKSYVVFYRPLPDGIEVLRVLHGSRDLEGILTSDLDDEPEAEDAPEAG